MAEILMESSWLDQLSSEFEKNYMKELAQFLAQEKKEGETVYPPTSLIFHAFCQTSFASTRVVIVGQDPYHGEGQAHGLCFSVPVGIALPPSLRNIFSELVEDLGGAIPSHGCLQQWAQQGVLLLNTILTVRAGIPRSHEGRGWELFTDRVLELLYLRQDPLVFILWGKSAYDKWKKVEKRPGRSHLILTAPHPSPLSAHSGFFGCRHFSKTNTFLMEKGYPPIDWGTHSDEKK